MKIKVCIANYGESQIWCLERMLQEFATYKKYNIDITIYTTVDIPGYNCKLYDTKIGGYLPYMCREDMVNDINQFDLFLYNENDQLITEKNIDAFLEFQNTLPENSIAGFLRYENRDEQYILVDISNNCIENRDEHIITFTNKHQGCFLLTQKLLKYCIDSGQFLHKEGRGPYGCLEQGATDPYNKCGLTKVFPSQLDKLKNHLILHISNKYAKQQLWLDKGVTIEQIMNK
jgi:uncharacterized ubiquitin-like protein YukD